MLLAIIYKYIKILLYGQLSFLNFTIVYLLVGCVIRQTKTFDNKIGFIRCRISKNYTRISTIYDFNTKL